MKMFINNTNVVSSRQSLESETVVSSKLSLVDCINKIQQAPPLLPKKFKASTLQVRRNHLATIAQPKHISPIVQSYECKGFDIHKIEQVSSLKIRAFYNAKQVVNPLYQKPASDEQILVLKKDGDDYFLNPLSIGDNKNKLAIGVYIFVILASSPGIILCGSQVEDFNCRVQGHTSLSKREDVLFAGEVLFKEGKLTKWTNCSGHYQPQADTRIDSLIPYVKTLLPEDKFVNVFDGEKFNCDIETLKGRGYQLPKMASEIE
ncbi:hypothetical protein [Vibrio misgurnus]|uniref:hypothetical protein n=1 Tax=Vibrio misgurnus TaxID=2993714 RepID=UPI0023F7F3DB|nr:hypothetical protein [Vibrio sp. VCS]